MNDRKKLAIKQVIRWLVLSVFFVLSMLYLNSAFFSAWVSDGPPNPYPIGWSRRALGHLCFALAALLIGIGLFKGIKTLPKIGKCSVAFVFIGSLLAVSPYIGRYVLIDSCLDRGEKWNHEAIQCSDE